MTFYDFKKRFSYKIRTDQPVLSIYINIHFEGPETIGENRKWHFMYFAYIFLSGAHVERGTDLQ